MRVRFYGTRGSIPTPGAGTVRHGGNTSCIEVRSSSGTLVVIDMGTGAFALGRTLAAGGEPVRGHVLISHTHWDHIQGLPFFSPFFAPSNEWDIYAPRGLGASLRDTLSGQMQYSYFPVTLEELGATIRYHDLVEGFFTVGDIKVEARYLNHPALTLGYRLKADGATIVYACDHEPHAARLATGKGALRGQDQRHVDFLAGADLVIHDAQFTAAEYPQKLGWGHSTIEYAIRVASAAGAKRLALTHHDPLRDDDALDALLQGYLASPDRPEGLDIFAASEGDTLDLVVEAPDGAEERPVQQAVMEPATLDQSVLLAISDPARAAELSELLETDKVDVAVVEAGRAAMATAAARPSLLVLEDPGDRAAIAATTAAIRGLGQYGRDLPIILVSDRSDQRADDEMQVSDRLVAPYSANYARTRLRAWLMRTACRWLRAPLPENEEERLASLHGLQILDTPREDRFDRITAIAAKALDAPIAAITLIDRDRQWFKSTYGLDVEETPRDESFCTHVVYDPAPLVVPDTLLDPRFADNPEVAGAPYIRFYAGQPLVLSDGHCIGTLCIVDTRPRELEPYALEQLRWLADVVTAEVERQD
jgi:ribonuclease BN (tRNA processing enzyme)/GAF domain-containing protein